MSQTAPPSALGEPAWEMATRFPSQGNWSAEEYLHVFANRGVELVDGRIEVLPMPTEEHQDILVFLFQALSRFVNERDLGKPQVAGLRVEVEPERFREPDVVFMLKEHKDRRESKFWRGADLVMEVVSEDDPDRDLTVKRKEYAAAGIAEYWIADPRTKTITVLTLPPAENAYAESGVYSEGDEASSVLLDGFRVDVTAAFTVE